MKLTSSTPRFECRVRSGDLGRVGSNDIATSSTNGKYSLRVVTRVAPWVDWKHDYKFEHQSAR